MEELFGRLAHFPFLQVSKEIGGHAQTVLGKSLKPLLRLVQDLCWIHGTTIYVYIRPYFYDVLEVRSEVCPEELLS